MAIKIKKRVDAPEGTGDPLLDEPDQFLQTADQSLGWAAKNQQLIVIIVGAVIVVVLAGVFLITHFQSKGAEQSAALTEAIDAMTAPVGEAKGAEAKPDGLRFVTEKDKYTAIDEKASAVLANYGGTKAADLAMLLKARAAFGLGNFDEAVGHYQKWLDTHKDGPERAFVLQAQASAQAAAGKADDAVTTLQSLKGLNDEVYGELASYQIGQVYEAAGQKDKAKAAYEELIKTYPDSSQLESVKMRLDLM